MTRLAPLAHDAGTDAERRGRMAREAEDIAQAEASLAAGRYVDAGCPLPSGIDDRKACCGD